MAHLLGEWIDPKGLYESSPYITHDPVKPVRFVQLFQSLPALEPFYTEFEKNFDVSASYKAISENCWVPIVACFLYMAILIEGTRASRKLNDDNPDRKKKPIPLVKLGNFPALWNLFLALFSIAGAIRVVPHFFFLFTHKTFKETVCAAPDKVGYGDGAAGMWVMLFTVSKVFELLDTVILVIKGKDVMFLHWYHHVTVLLYTWFSYSARNPGLYFIAMNYSVHAIMYSYYFLMEVKLWPKWLSPIGITLGQISQMFAGVFLTYKAWEYSKSDPECDVVKHMLPWCAAMYATYLYFFVEFFARRFLGGGDKKKKTA